MRYRQSTRVLTAFVLLAMAFLASHCCAAKDVSSSFTFVVIGDTRPGGGQYEQPRVFKQMVGEIAKLKPAFVLHTGDFVPGSSDLTKLKRQYWEFKKVMDTVGVPYYLALGNHEISGADAHRLFRSLLGKTYYAFNYGNSHFVALDAAMPGDMHRINDVQFAWLEMNLAAAKGKSDHVFVMGHDPLYPVDGHIGSSLDTYPDRRDKLAALLKKYGAIYFTGHEHLFDHCVYDGLTQVITGGGGAELYRSKKGTGYFHHYVIVKVNGRSAKMSVARPGETPSAPVDLVPKRGAKPAVMTAP